jgi:hypothetical protein
MKLPKFMTEESAPTPYSKALEAYGRRFGFANLSTEDKYLTEDEWVEVLNACVEKGIEIDEYLGLGDIDPEDYI